LVGVSITVYVTSDRVVNSLNTLSRANLPTRAAAAALNNDVVSTHIKVFRFVSWASNSVGEKLLRELRKEIDGDFLAIHSAFETLANRPDLSTTARAGLDDLHTKLKQYESTAKDTLDVGGTDAPMATMMLGQTDDRFINISDDIRKILTGTTARSNSLIENIFPPLKQKEPCSRRYWLLVLRSASLALPGWPNRSLGPLEMSRILCSNCRRATLK
jgi:hypothetical protein